MKRIITLLALSLFFFPSLHAAWLENVPVTEIQPNGDTIHFFATGDECYHRFHDAQNYTLLMDARGYWVYAQPTPDGSIKPSQYIYPVANPATLGLTPGLTISRQEWEVLKKQWEVPADRLPRPAKTSGRNHGDYCNLVIFIRFADDTSFAPRAFSTIDRMFTDTSASTSSLYNYFVHASYNKIFMRTHYAPAPLGDSILSYQAPHSRNYYKPYSENNPQGYHSNQRADREFDLIQGAINYINQNHPIPSDVVLDCDGDGYIDNVNFIVKGTYTGWSDLLWPHKWNLYSRECYINGKRVSTFNLQLEGSGPSYFGPSTFCHEMFHSLGAPDLYRYNSPNNTTPVGGWDLMATNATPPQHMSAYMKYKYGNWIDSIPTITQPGNYTLRPLADSACINCCYKIPSIDTNQFFVLEYRHTDRPFEGNLPGKGLLIYRVDKRFNGNAGYDDDDVFDEIWVMRPGSTSVYEDGQLARAAFSADSRRTEFSSASSPYPHLYDGQRDMHFSITNIGYAGNTINFYYSNRTIPAGLISRRITTSSASVAWAGGSQAYRLRYRPVGSDQPYSYIFTTNTYTTILGLQPNTLYEWSVNSLYGDNNTHAYTDSTRYSTSETFHTEICNNPVSDTLAPARSDERTGVPFTSNEKYNYTQIIYNPEAVGSARHISSISIQYAYTTPLEKNNCTIYMANTDLDHFSSDSNHIPASALTPVFSGDLVFNKGWNSIILDSSFLFDGEHNLLIAIDDNSGVPSRVGNKFYCNTTTAYTSSVYYGDENHNPGPEQDSIVGSHTTHNYRPNIAFTGCPLSHDQVYACVFAEDPGMGYTEGEGYYNPGTRIFVQAYPVRQNTFSHWHDGIPNNPRLITLTSDTLLIAIFAPPVGITDDASEAAGFTVLSQGLSATVVCTAGTPVRVFDLLGRTLVSDPDNRDGRISFRAPATGIYLVQIGNAKPQKILLSEY